MSRYIAAYDVSDDHLRRRVSRVLDGYGHRLQLSVYEVWLEPDELPDFRRRIGSLLSHQDRFDLIPIDVHPHRVRLRWLLGVDEYDPVIVLGFSEPPGADDGSGL